jgi:hypothetical protein
MRNPISSEGEAYRCLWVIVGCAMAIVVAAAINTWFGVAVAVIALVVVVLWFRSKPRSEA